MRPPLPQPGKPLVPFIPLRVAFCAALLSVGVAESSRADEAPPRPNLLVITVEGLDNVGVPAEGLDEVLFDPEVRARATPNLARLVAKGARFDRAYGHAIELDPENLRAHASVKGGYLDGGVAVEAPDPPPHEKKPGIWSSPTKQAQRRWIRLTPKDPTVANWELLANSQEAIATAASVAAAIGQPDKEGKPRLLSVKLGNGFVPSVPGVFFDRFPLDQIRLPADPENRRALAERMGAYGFDTSDLTETEELAWKRAIQAWLAGASALDYAVGTIVDALDATEAPWAVALVASPPEDVPPAQQVRETGSRAGLVIAAPGVTQPGQRVATPVEIRSLARTLVELIGVDPNRLNDWDNLEEPVSDARGNYLAPLPGESLLPRLAPAGDRYDLVAITGYGETHGVRSHRFRLVHTEESQALYDMEKDPEGFYDLLDADNAAKVKRFGLTASQVEAVRQWHTLQLYRRLARSDQEEADLEKLAEWAGLDPGVEIDLDPPAVIPGDYNRDGRVDAADTTIWRDQNGKEVPVGSGADGDFDGRVDDLDNIIWRKNYGRRAESP